MHNAFKGTNNLERLAYILYEISCCSWGLVLWPLVKFRLWTKPEKLQLIAAMLVISKLAKLKDLTLAQTKFALKCVKC